MSCVHFEDLVGKKFCFYGVDNNALKLGDQIFEAVEDECDGYRSMLGYVSERSADGLIFSQLPLATVEVRPGTDIDGYELVDTVNGHVWLEFGTENCDDYYPFFTFRYTPKES